MSIRRCAAVALALTAVLAAGCMTRPVKRNVYTEGRIAVSLREEKRWTRTVAKEYEHPVTIAPVRMAHILSRIDLRTTTKKGNQRMSAIPTEMLYPIAEGVSHADQAEFLAANGCHEMQGFFFSAAIPAAAFREKLQLA